MRLSKNKVAQAVNSGRSTFILPWPVERLGEYGSGMFDGSRVTPASTDRAMDLYVQEVLSASLDATNVALGAGIRVCLVGCCAGRTHKGEPVIVVTLAAIAGEGISS